MKEYNNKKSTACNKRFAASGGVARLTVLREFGSLALVQTSVNPPPDGKPPDVSGNARATQHYSEQ
jgi:hypothetical protein